MLSVQRAEGLRALLQATHGSPLGSLWGGQLRLHPWEDSVLLQRRRAEALPAALHGAQLLQLQKGFPELDLRPPHPRPWACSAACWEV